jgi:hypothetical protein
MDIKQEFTNIMYDVKISNEVAINEFVKISDNYAIKFAKWIIENQNNSFDFKHYTNRQILDIFKKL